MRDSIYTGPAEKENVQETLKNMKNIQPLNIWYYKFVVDTTNV
jgi:hypothetical protein